MSPLDHHRPTGSPVSREFRLDRQHGKVFGVCSGMGNYFGVDPMWIRVGFVAGTILGFGTFALVYLGVALIAD